jgi:hypothetical protein
MKHLERIHKCPDKEEHKVHRQKAAERDPQLPRDDLTLK